VGVSHEAFYRHVYSDKAPGGVKCRYALFDKVCEITSDPVIQEIITKFNVVAQLVKTITFDDGKSFAEYSIINTTPKIHHALY
jgi:IS30 family transposase